MRYFTDYTLIYNDSYVLPDKRGICEQRAKDILGYKNLYMAAAAATKTPWDVIACIHSLEAELSLVRHLHNGDPLTGRTVNIPIGRPAKGNPPFAWTDSCIDALSPIPKPDLWNLDWKLYFLESYNGFGYRKLGLNSPYLWSMTNKYERGKFVADGCFNEEATSCQIGAVAIMKSLEVLTK